MTSGGGTRENRKPAPWLIFRNDRNVRPTTLYEMTAPREILPGTTYLVTRRCTQRQFLLRPSRATNQTFTYCLAVPAGTFGMLIHDYKVMSNHYHLILTDVRGQLPEFMAGNTRSLVDFGIRYDQ